MILPRVQDSEGGGGLKIIVVPLRPVSSLPTIETHYDWCISEQPPSGKSTYTERKHR